MPSHTSPDKMYQNTAFDPLCPYHPYYWFYNPSLTLNKPYCLNQGGEENHLKLLYSIFILAPYPQLAARPEIPPTAYLMAESSLERIPFSSSVKRGSTFTWITISLPRASAALRRTARFESCRALVKVVCSWGKNGFRAISTFKRDKRRKSDGVENVTMARNQSL